jgi:hypothetical protein
LVLAAVPLFVGVLQSHATITRHRSRRMQADGEILIYGDEPARQSFGYRFYRGVGPVAAGP